MVWNMLLAHSLGDFLLQTDWIARRKENFGVLCLHVGIVFAMMFLLAGEPRSVLWPYLLLIAVTHVAQDSLKISLTKLKQHARVPFFLLDQLLHLVIIVGVLAWFNATHGPLPEAGKPTWAILLLTGVLVTYVWFITERVIYADDKGYVENINQTKYARMFSRASGTGLFFLLRMWLFPGLFLFLSAPYPRSRYQKRAVLIDVCVCVCGLLFLIWALA
jgi:hypothetical protein